MAKNKSGFRKIIVFATIAGAVAAGISYFTKYKSFHKELEEDFHDFEDDTMDGDQVDSTMSRNYVTLGTVKAAAEEAGDTLKNIASEGKMAIAETGSKAADQIKDAKDTASEMVEDVTDEITTIIEDVTE